MATAREGSRRSSVTGISSTSRPGSSPTPTPASTSKVRVDESKSEHAIRERAYLLWEQSGCPHGRDIEFWLKARKEILGK
jgi:hypothetical protein